MRPPMWLMGLQAIHFDNRHSSADDMRRAALGYSGTREPADARLRARSPPGRLGHVPMVPLTKGGRAFAPYCAASR